MPFLLSQGSYPAKAYMLAKLSAGTGLLLDRTFQHTLGRLLLSRNGVAVFRHAAVFVAFSVLGVVLVWPIFGPGYPPGVDTPTFFHLSWVTKLAVSGQLADPFRDPYWYGGFPYLVSYPPLGYGLVAVISFVTRLDLINVYVALLIMAYGGLAAATYWLAAELGLRRWTAALSGILVALAYPVLNSIFLWGWFTSLMSLPFGLVAFLLLERAMRTARWKPAAWGGLCMALSLLTHHMTGLSLGLGLAGWLVYHAVSGLYPRRMLVAYSGLFVTVTALVVLPWVIPFMMHILDVGFRREVPGLWLPNLATYRNNIIDSTLIGAHVYPSYLGITLLVLATGGTAFALLERQRLGGLAVVLLVLLWFSMGANLNPLLKVYPFSGLDAARFHLYMVPFMALLGAALVERTFNLLKELWPTISPVLRYSLLIAVLIAILAFPVKDAWKARDFMEPYRVKGPVVHAINWLAEFPSSEDDTRGRVYSVGLWTWHTFLIPYLANRPLIDGWHDEGASNVDQIRELRLMGWTGNVDIQRAHRILSEQGAGYVLVNRISDYPVERSDLFWDGFEDHPEWFEKQEQWGDVAVFRVLPSRGP